MLRNEAPYVILSRRLLCSDGDFEAGRIIDLVGGSIKAVLPDLRTTRRTVLPISVLLS